MERDLHDSVHRRPSRSPSARRMVSYKGVDHPYRPVFHYDDVPDDIVAEDQIGYPHEQTATFPHGRHCTCRGRTSPPSEDHSDPTSSTTKQPRSMPVLIANGEVDVCPDPRTEPAAYPSSTDITTFVLPRSGHMHNFAGTRQPLAPPRNLGAIDRFSQAEATDLNPTCPDLPIWLAASTCR